MAECMYVCMVKLFKYFKIFSTNIPLLCPLRTLIEKGIMNFQEQNFTSLLNFSLEKGLLNFQEQNLTSLLYFPHNLLLA